MSSFGFSRPTWLAVAILATNAQADEFVSQSASLSFTVPIGLKVLEREVFDDAQGRAPRHVMVFQLVPAGLSESEALRSVPMVEILSIGLAAPLSSDRWALETPCRAVQANDEPVKVAGEAGIRRTNLGRLGPGEGRVRFFVAKGARGYVFSSGPRPEDEALLNRVLETARLEAEPNARAADVSPSAASTKPVVRMVYLIPSDVVVPDEGYRLGIENAIRQLQTFYRSQFGDGRTFLLNEPAVEIVHTGRPVSWYQTDAPANSPEYRFYNAATGDGLTALGGKFYDPSNRWIFYIDAQPLCGQFIGGGGGVALLGRGDLSGLTCDTYQPFCPPEGPDLRGLCRWVGGLGHELGHAFELGHPTAGACPAPDTSCSSALMWTGYARYPSAYFLPSERSMLLTSPTTAPFFVPFDPGPFPRSCTAGCPPGRPSGLTAALVNGRVNLAWNAAPGATSYVVRRSVGANAGPYGALASAVTPSHSDGALVNGESYFYLVHGVNAVGEGPHSNLAAVTLPGVSISSIVPNAGSTAGGTAVSVEGAGFVAGATVTVGGTPLSSPVVVDPRLMTGVTGAHPPGVVDVSVSVPGPFSGALGGAFFYFDPPPAARLFTIPPCRLIDTRTASLGGPDPLAATARRDFTVTGGACGVPASASAISVNLTVVSPSAPGYVSVFPGNGIPARTSTINFSAGQTRANDAVVLLATNGAGTVGVLNGSTGAVHLILDVNGYFQ